MASVTINRKTIRRAVKRGKRITGADLPDCAVAIAAKMGLHPTCIRKVFEILLRLEEEGWLRLVGGRLRPWTPSARQAELERRRRRIAAPGGRKRKGDRPTRVRSRQRDSRRPRPQLVAA